MANLWRDGSDAGAFRPRLKYQPLVGNYVFIPTGCSVANGIILPRRAQVIFDFGCHWEGELRWKPYDDSRMVLKGVGLPPYSEQADYKGAVKIFAMVQHYGPCELKDDGETICLSIKRLYDTFIFAPEAAEGKLPIWRIEEPRPFHSKFQGQMFGPIWSLITWIDRDPSPHAFGPRLIPPPKPQPALIYEVATAPTVETDKLFDASQGEVLPPEPTSSSKPKATKRGAKREPQHGPRYDAGLNDELPF